MKEKLEDVLKNGNIADFLSWWIYNDVLSPESSRVFNRYYNAQIRHFGIYLQYYYNRRTKDLMEILKRSSNTDVLEIGTGCGTEALWIASTGGGGSVTAIDVSEDKIDTARERKRIIEDLTKRTLNIDFRSENIINMDTNKKFDIIWMEDAFHHLEPREQVLIKIGKLCKNDGYLIMSETNAWNPLLQLYLIKLNGFKKIIKQGDFVYGNERLITPRSLKAKLEHQGFKNITYEYFRTLPAVKWADKFLCPKIKIPVPFVYTIYNLVAQKEQKHE